MRIRHLTTTVALGTASLLVAMTPTPPDGFTYEPESEQIYLAIGCQQADDGATCASTEYFLSTRPGQSNVASTRDATPQGTILYYADGEYVTQAYSADTTLQETYVLRADEDITGQVTLRSWGGDGTEFAADAGVYVNLRGRVADGQFSRAQVIGEAEVEKVVMTPGDNVFEFTIDVPEELDGVEVSGLGLDLGIRGVNVLTSGFVDGTGGSLLHLPFYEAVPVADED